MLSRTVRFFNARVMYIYMYSGCSIPLSGRQAGRLADGQTGRQMERQTDKQTNRDTNRETDKVSYNEKQNPDDT